MRWGHLRHPKARKNCPSTSTTRTICVLSAAHQVLQGGYEGNDCPKGLPLPSTLLAPLCPWLCKRRSVPLRLCVIQMYISP